MTKILYLLLTQSKDFKRPESNQLSHYKQPLFFSLEILILLCTVDRLFMSF